MTSLTLVMDQNLKKTKSIAYRASYKAYKRMRHNGCNKSVTFRVHTIYTVSRNGIKRIPIRIQLESGKTLFNPGIRISIFDTPAQQAVKLEI